MGCVALEPLNRCDMDDVCMQQNSNRHSLCACYSNVQGILITEKTEARRQELARDKDKAVVLLDYLRKVNLADRDRNKYLRMKALMLEVCARRAQRVGQENRERSVTAQRAGHQ